MANADYRTLRPVYALWIYTDPLAEDRFTVRRYGIARIERGRPAELSGSGHDKLNIITIGLGPEGDDVHESVRWLLKPARILRNVSSMEKLRKDVKQGYGIDLSKDAKLEKTMNRMQSMIDEVFDSALNSAVDSPVDSPVKRAMDRAVDRAVKRAVDSAVKSAVKSAVENALSEQESQWKARLSKATAEARADVFEEMSKLLGFSADEKKRFSEQLL